MTHEMLPPIRMGTPVEQATDIATLPTIPFETVPTVVVLPTLPESIEEAFRLFHAANPWVYNALVQLTRDLVQRGNDRVGIGMLFEVLRWNWAMTTADPSSEFKLNNNYRSRYARMIMEREADLADVFEIRALRSL